MRATPCPFDPLAPAWACAPIADRAVGATSRRRAAPMSSCPADPQRPHQGGHRRQRRRRHGLLAHHRVPVLILHHTFGYPTFRGSKRGIHYGRIRLPDAAGGPFPIVINFHGGFWPSGRRAHGPSTPRCSRRLARRTPPHGTWSTRVDQSDPRRRRRAAAGRTPASTRCRAERPRAARRAGERHPRRDRPESRVYLCALRAVTRAVVRVPRGCRRRSLSACAAVEALAGAKAGAAARAGVHADITVVGVVGLAPVTSLRAAAADGLSDHHDAVPTCGEPAIRRRGRRRGLDAACPLALFRAVPAAAGRSRRCACCSSTAWRTRRCRRR